MGPVSHIRKELEALIIQSPMLAPGQKAWERDFLEGGARPKLKFIIIVGGDLPL